MIDTIKTLLGVNDAVQDDIIDSLITLTTARVCSRINASTLPDELQPVVIEVVIARYNRIGSEGLTSHSVDGESMSWADDDFAPYERDLQDWIDKQSEPTRGVIRFL